MTSTIETPTWQAGKDGSKVVVIGPRVSVPDPHSDRDIPRLLLGTTGTGPGLFGRWATYNFWVPAGA